MNDGFDFQHTRREAPAEPTFTCVCLRPQSVLPFFVATKMTRIRKPTFDKPTPERYVAAELSTVGLQSQTNGYFPHAIMVRRSKGSAAPSHQSLLSINQGFSTRSCCCTQT